MKAVLLAAGRGTRLAPLTDRHPKILAPLGGRPLLAHQLEYLRRSGVDEVAINVSHFAEQVQAFLEESEFGVAVRVSVEDELLGTAGALVPLREFLTEAFLVLYGDVVTNVDLATLMARHQESECIATLAYYESDDAQDKGILELSSDGRVESFVEKPVDYRGVGRVNAGIYALEPDILAFVGTPPVDFGNDVWPTVLAAGVPIQGHAISGYLRDIGSPEALAAAERDLRDGTLTW